MSEKIAQLEPQLLWKNFSMLNAVPRPSKKEERVIEFMMNFGQKLGLEVIKDKIGNVIIKKNATKGLESKETVILQSHLDMVHQKNEVTVFDFDSQGIEMILDGDWVKAKGTTLGADNGIGVAAIMALLESTDIEHPALEAMFTIDEETGMTGAKELEPKNFTGKILLNLDTEDDDELSIGCAGGIDTNTEYSYTQTSIRENFEKYKISIHGLLGGHSGMDIDKGRGNANKLLTRIIYNLAQNEQIQLINFFGGSLRNAIPREANAIIAFHKDNEVSVLENLAEIRDAILLEFIKIEPELKIDWVKSELEEKALENDCMVKILQILHGLHNGVFRMSPEIANLVETSSSLAKVTISKGKFTTQSLQRSSIESGKRDIADTIKCSFEIMGSRVEQVGDYPGWKPDSNSVILRILDKLYQEKFNEKPQIKACHAGLECGILSKHLPLVDMISFGPNIRGAHSPDEKVQISSVQKFWDFLLEVLKRIPEAQIV